MDVISARKQVIKNCHRLVLKAGTRLLTDPDALPELVQQIHAIRQSGRQVILVSSGAVGTAMKAVGLKKRPRHLSEVQALAAMGQVKLMSMYEEECLKYGFRAAQLLLTADDLRSRERHLNAENCIEALLSHNVLPIINENDPVSVAELKFGDNDILASLLGSMVRADLTIILTTVDGLLKPNPDGTFGDRISLIRGITAEERAMALGTDDASMSIGGMESKLRAAETVNSAGEALWIASGKTPHILEKIFDGEDVGTLFLPPESKRKMESRKRWLATFSKSYGTITVDAGCCRALTEKGSSLLPSGMTDVTGTFKRGDVVTILSSEGKAIAKGKTNFSAAECAKLFGCHSDDIQKLLGFASEEEIIHRNNLVLLPKH